MLWKILLWFCGISCMKKLFYNVVHISSEMLSFFSSLRFLLKVSIWCRCQNWIALPPWSMMESNKDFIKKYISKYTGWAKRRRILIYLTKIMLKTTSNAIFIMKKNDLDESNWTGACISWKKLCSHTFKASLEEVIVMRKWRQNT